MPDSTVTIVGNLTRAPELRFTSRGRAVCSFGVAVNRRYQQNGEWTEQVSFFNVTAWAELGENIAATLDKGNRVIVFGRLEQREYETKDGEKRTAVEVVADSVGPDLRWAQATVQRTERSDGGTSGGTARGGSTNSPVYGDEEPFARPAEIGDL